MRRPHSPVSPLLFYIDDSRNDQILVEQAIRSTNIPLRLLAVDNVDAAMDYFRGNSPFGGDRNPFPDALLLDYEIGNQTAVDLLSCLRSERKLTHLPVIIYSGCVADVCVDKCYRAGANYFLTKPKSFSRVQAIVRTLYKCMASYPPQLAALCQLSEYRCAPGEDLLQLRPKPVTRMTTWWSKPHASRSRKSFAF